MRRQHWMAIAVVVLLVLASFAVASGSAGRALPIWNPGYNGQLPPASDPAYEGQDATTRQGPDVECSDTDLSNPAAEPICPTPAGSPVANPSSDTNKAP